MVRLNPHYFIMKDHTYPEQTNAAKGGEHEFHEHRHFVVRPHYIEAEKKQCA